MSSFCYVISSLALLLRPFLAYSFVEKVPSQQFAILQYILVDKRWLVEYHVHCMPLLFFTR